MSIINVNSLRTWVYMFAIIFVVNVLSGCGGDDEPVSPECIPSCQPNQECVFVNGGSQTECVTADAEASALDRDAPELDSDSPQSTEPISEGGFSCDNIIRCIERCAHRDVENCREGCFELGSTQGRQDFDKYLLCHLTRCPAHGGDEGVFRACMLNACPQPADACLGDREILMFM